MSPPRNVIFDVGNVLLRWDPDALIRDQLRDESLHAMVRREMFDHEDWQLLDHGKLEEQEANGRFQQRTGLPIEKVRGLMLGSKATLAPMQQGLDLLDELRHLGVRVYCLTNMARDTFTFLRQRYRFWEKFEGIVVSAHVGLLKPDPAIFTHLLTTYGLNGGDTAFMDDNPRNVEGARAAGVRARVYDDGDAVREWLLAGAA